MTFDPSVHHKHLAELQIPSARESSFAEATKTKALGGNDVAQWMKIASWKPGDDPIATLLNCYDYLPGVEPPKNP